MPTLDLQKFESVLKEHYTADRVEQMVYKDHPFLALVSKYTNFGGKNLPVPITYGVPQGRSSSFAAAKANKFAGLYTDFVLTRAKDYSLASIDNETLEASVGNENAFMEAAITEIDGAFLSASRSLATSLFRDGAGTIGRMANSAFDTPLLQLTDPNDVVAFEVGQTIQLSSAGTVATLRNGGATGQIVAVNRDTGVLTLDDDIDDIWSAGATNDFINVEGDLEAKVVGLEGWVPATAPGSTPFFGVDRSVDPTRLGGIRFNGVGMPLEEALIGGANRIGREGGAPNYCFVNYDKFADLEKSLGSKVQYVDLKASAEIGFRGIMIHGPRGPINVVADQNCQADVAWMLDMNTWKLYSLGEAPKILMTDGLRMLREADADGVEVRIGYYAQLGSRAPGWSGRIQLD